MPFDENGYHIWIVFQFGRYGNGYEFVTVNRRFARVAFGPWRRASATPALP